MNTIIAGNSHTVALRKAWKSRNQAQRYLTFALWVQAEKNAIYFLARPKWSFIFAEILGCQLEKFLRLLFKPRDQGFLLGSSSHDIYQDKFWRDAEPAEICDAKNSQFQ